MPSSRVVVVREPDAVLAAAAHALDGGEEEVVVREAEVRREVAVEPLDARVEALHEHLELVGLGGRARLVDLDPLRPELDERLEVRPDDVAGDVERELAPGGDLRRTRRAGAEPLGSRAVVLVVRPDGERVRAGDRDLELRLGHGLEVLELGVVVRLAQPHGAGDGRLRVVLVVEAPHGAARLEALGVRDRPGVHLRAQLLAVPDDVEAGLLLEPERVAARPARDLVLRLLAGALLEQRDELLVAGHRQPLAPGASVIDVSVAERPAGRRLHEPRRLRQRADFMREEAHAHAASPFAAPSAASFRFAIGSATNWRSPFGTSASSPDVRSLSRAAKLARAAGSSTSEERASTTPASRSFGKPSGHGVERREVEVHADPVHGEVDEAIEQRRGVAERQLQDKRAPCRQLRERVTERGDVCIRRACEERLRQDDQLRVERLDGGREHGGGNLPRIDAGRLAERVRGGQRHETRSVEVGHGVGAERLRQARRSRRVRRPEERVRVEEAREGACLQPLARVDERPKEVLPGEHAVGEEVEAGLGLGGDQRLEIGGAPAFDVVGRDAATVEVARRLDERLGPRVDAWGDTPSLRTPYGRPATVSWFSAWRTRCSSCQRSASDVARFDALELRLRVLELLLRPLRVDLTGIDGVVDEREGAVLLDLEESRPRRELDDVPLGDVHARRAGLQHRHERGVASEDADLAGGAGHDDHLREALVRGAFRRHERDLELLALVGHYPAATGSASASSVSSACSGSSAASGTVTEPCAAWTASSIVPTM